MPDTPDQPKGFIVVGIDGSDESKDALRWAVRQAEFTKAQLRVLIAWHFSSTASGWGLTPPRAGHLEGTSRDVLDRTVKEVLGDDHSIDVTSIVKQGHPAPALLEAAEGADALVVGGKGHGAFAGMLLGSVGEHCVRHALCPVVVVRCPSPSG